MDDARTEEQLIAKLRTGLAASDPAPSDVAEFAQAVFSWRLIDAELAELSFDSSVDETAGVRSTMAARMVTFEVGRWSIDIEYNEMGERLLGQVDPASRVTVELHYAGGAIATETDELGRFDFDDVLPGPVSLVIRTSGDIEVIKTEWIVL
jgi:hypothetical protein